LVQDSVILSPYKEIKTINEQLLALTELIKQGHTENTNEITGKSGNDLLGEIVAAVQQRQANSL